MGLVGYFIFDGNGSKEGSRGCRMGLVYRAQNEAYMLKGGRKEAKVLYI